MTQLRIGSAMSTGAATALEPHVDQIYNRPGGHWVAVVEFRHVERTQVVDDTDKEPVVRCKITGMEIPNDEQEAQVRNVQRALYLQRTARGTLLDDGGILLDETTLQDCAGMLHAIEVARLRTAMHHWDTYIRKVVANSHNMSITEMAHEVEMIADGLHAALLAIPRSDD